ncbi:MAG: hypothetical protein FD167_722 [bacterium]|nr:MAG: hypothetical protein FD167_722 [bacterium]
MMFCPFCGHQNRDGKKFCRQCGRTLPAPKTSTGTTPLPHYNSFTQEPVSSSVETNFPLNNQNQSTPANQLIDQNLNGFSPSIDNSSSSSAITPQWQPDVALKSNQEYVEGAELEDQLNQFTQNLLPDTVGFEVPKSMPSLGGNGESGYQKPNGISANNPTAKPQISFFSSSGLDLKKSPSPTKLPSTRESKPIVDFNDYNDGDYPTDEMEALFDRSGEKTEDIPILTEKTADMPVLIEKPTNIAIVKPPVNSNPTTSNTFNISNITPVIPPSTIKPSPTTHSISTNNIVSNNASRPLPAMLSITSPTGALVENSQRTERVILIILTLIALIGISILVWILILRPLGIVYCPAIPSEIAKDITFRLPQINWLELMSLLRYNSLVG